MSELISRIRRLNDEISFLKEQVLRESCKYADEIDHSDLLAHFLSLAHDGRHCPPICSFCDIIRTHEHRRLDDHQESLKTMSKTEQLVADI
jgi:hypothetical protein